MRQLRQVGFAALFAAAVFALVPTAAYAVTVEIVSGVNFFGSQSGTSPLAVNLPGTDGLTVTGTLTDLQAGGLDQLIFSGMVANTGAAAVTADVLMFSNSADFAATPPGVYAATLSASGQATDNSGNPLIDSTNNSFTVTAAALDNTSLALPQFQGNSANPPYSLGPATGVGPCGLSGEISQCFASLSIDLNVTLQPNTAFTFPINLSQTTAPVPEPMTALLMLSGVAGYGVVRRFRRTSAPTAA